MGGRLLDAGGVWIAAMAALGLLLGCAWLARSGVRAARAPAPGAQSDPWFEAAPIGLCRFDLEGRIVAANRALRDFLGLEAAAVPGLPFSSITHAEDLEQDCLDRSDLLSGLPICRQWEKRFRCADGRWLWASCTTGLLRDAQGRPRGFIAAIEDVGAHRRGDALLQARAEKLGAVVEHMAVAVWMSTPDRSRVLFVNDAFESIWGLSRESFYARPDLPLQRIHPDDRDRLREAAAGAGPSYEFNYRIVCDDGGSRYVRNQGRGIFDSRGRLRYRVDCVTDISGEMQMREALREANERLLQLNHSLREDARLDSLTRCLNRGAFFEELEKALQLEQRHGRSSTLVFFDLNNFKKVNDNFGHHVGDRALIAFVEQIKARLRTTDELGRYGGDEFLALLRETDAEQAHQLLATLMPVVVDAENGNSVILRFSTGVACSDDPVIETAYDWARIADSQMYYQRTRRNGR